MINFDRMETPYLDNLIEMYEQYESKNWLMDDEKKQLVEFKKIKQALRIHDVIGRSELLIDFLKWLDLQGRYASNSNNIIDDVGWYEKSINSH